MQEIALSFSIFMSGITIGIGSILYAEVREAKKLYKAKIEEFELIMKKASEANLSLAEKILQLEEKVNTMEFWRTSVLKGK